MRKHLLNTFILPFFFVGFACGYQPYGIMEMCNLGYMTAYAHIVLIGCIILLVLMISRLAFWLVERNVHPLVWWLDFIWCIVEAFVACCFVGMYISLFRHEFYFKGLVQGMEMVYGILIYPYAILFLIEELVKKNEQLKHKGTLNQEDTVKFYDEHKKLKFIVAATSILYIKADDNVVRINYLESGKVKEFAVRTSMKSLEEMAAKFNILRCQRSYYINPAFVKVLRKDNEGFIYADLNISGVEPIPVSKKYFDSLSAIL